MNCFHDFSDFCFEPVGVRPQLCKKVCDEFDPTKEPLECIATWFETKGYVPSHHSRS